MSKILLAEDVDGARVLYRTILEAAGHVVTEACDGCQCLDRLISGAFDLLVTDVVMPGLDGVEVIKAARNIRPGLPIIAISGGEPDFPAAAALNLSSMYGADVALFKPFKAERLIEAVRSLLG
ncbi:MAG: response regulator [Magnetospirillum sp.]|nr:response regulator [Magnetospirillum sp.]